MTCNSQVFACFTNDFSLETVVESHENILETYCTCIKWCLDSRLRVDTRINGIRHLESEFTNTFAIWVLSGNIGVILQKLTVFIRHLYRAVSTFKPTCKKSNFQNSCFWHFQKTHTTQEELRHHKIIFVFLRYYFNRNFIDHAFESYFMFKNETHILEAFFVFAKRIIKVLKRLSFWQK